jgi:hypothetical protein
MCELQPRRPREIDTNNTHSRGSENLTQNLVADLRTALRSLRLSIQTAASKPEEARATSSTNPRIDGS